MMNLVSQCSERTPDVLAATASESPGKNRYERQFPLISQTEQHQRTGRFVEDVYSSSHIEWNVDKTWSSQEWKSDELMEVGTLRPVLFAQHTDMFVLLKTIIWTLTPKQNQKCRQNPDHSCTGWMIKCERGSTNLQKMQQKQRQTLCDMVNVYVFYIASICIHGEDLLRQYAFHQKYRRSHNETDVRHIWEIDIRTVRRDLWSEYN